MSDIRDDRRYSKDHEWAIPVGGGRYRVGISDYAQDQLGDVVFVELPEEGAELGAGDPVGVLESVKTVSDLYSPLAGKVVAVNQALEDQPELVNQDPYGEGWIFELDGVDEADYQALMDASAYSGHVGE